MGWFSRLFDFAETRECPKCGEAAVVREGLGRNLVDPTSVASYFCRDCTVRVSICRKCGKIAVLAVRDPVTGEWKE